ncbi:N-acetylmuramoyl-L-alanine amidase [Peribacillus tepidiphilus]|uniref:N-acetylmuramoyl-L-alanine amidase n=1 Tax=Peribacillus tepidiphilus TaxID=2652445 RepID=UPI00129259D6|nr:N-acetylmuramoyl-L-alanine amidase [Peribacillus tepidiphilus]
MTKRIVIDAGHGGKDPGAAANGLLEKNITLTLSKYMQDYLNDHYTGFEVKLTRSTDVFIELSKRADIANAYKADVFISNHVNAGGGSGFESFVYNKPSATSVTLQNLLNTEALATAKKYGLGAHGVANKRGNLAVVRETNMPAILTEICFIDSKDATLLKKDAFLRDMAAAYARGIAKFLGLPAKQKAPAATKLIDKKLHRVQVGAFSDRKNAEELVKRLKKAGFDGIIV